MNKIAKNIVEKIISKNLYIVLFVLLSISTTTYSFSNIVWNFINSDANSSNNDNWSLNWDYTFQSEDWNSVPDWTIVAKIKWEIKSELFWYFSFWISNPDINFIKTSRTECLSWPTYAISGNIKSFNNIRWDMDFVQTSSYFCPLDWKWKWILYSDQLWYKEIWNLLLLTDLSVWTSYNLENKLLVKWLLWTNTTVDINNWDIINDSNNQSTKVLQLSIPKTDITMNINKNIIDLTKNIIAETNISNNIINNFNAKNTYYFNYETKIWSISNEDNKWIIVEIKNWNYNINSLSNYQVWITWEKNLIVKWWNIYINADIYNTNKNSILVIVAQRDDTNNKNWWNIYINPNVTNIDAVIIAEGSIINYNWTNVITNADSLRNQLYIYWSTFTKNSIWTWINPYGSDWYIKDQTDLSIWYKKYDLAELRKFDLIASNTWTLDEYSTYDCSSSDNKLVPRLESISMKAKKYAWAGKRECFNELDKEVDPSINNLRWLTVFNPLIIEYNPIISTKPPFLLKNN